MRTFVGKYNLTAHPRTAPYGIVSDKLICQMVSVAREDGMPGLLQDCALQVEISGQNI